ncbi:MAG: glycosyltransferase family 39 protein [Rubrivivax sp.]
MTAPRAPSRRDALPLLAVLAWLAATIGVRPLMLPDEGRYVGVAWEMLQRGDWLTPTLDGLPFFHKPPLFYWITAAALRLAGPVEWAARAAPLLGAGVGAAALYGLLLRWCGRGPARQALLVLAAQPLFYLGGQFANMDMLVAGCITAAVCLLADAVLRLEAGLPPRWALLGAWLAAALGVLAKGLIGAVLPALVIMAWLALSRRLRLLPRLLPLPGLLLFAAVVLPWFAAMQQRHAGFLDEFFVVQHLQRYAAGGFNNVQPPWFYPLLLLAAFLPWLPWLWRAARAVDEPGRHEAPSLRLLMLVWAALVVAFFSLPRSKLIGYVLPAVPPLAALAAHGFAATVGGRRGWIAAAALGAVVGAGIVLGLGLHPVRSTKPLALALGAARQPGEPVLMLQGYRFDLPFYARLEQPAGVVDDWGNPEIARRDDWRRELAEAGRFSPRDAAARLIAPAALPAVLCAAPRSWVVGPASAARAQPLLAQAAVAAADGELRLWRVEPRAAASGGPC